MKRVLKVISAVCLGILIWMLLMVCLFLIWKTKTESMVEEFGITSTEVSSDLADKKVEEGNEESTNVVKDVNDGSVSVQNTGREEIYFDSIQEAVNANYLNSDEECLYQRNLENIIKRFEINNYIIVCYNAIKNPREEAFIIAYFKIKEEEENKKYAYVWNEIQERTYSKKPKIELEELIQNQITGSKFRMMNSIGDEKGFIPVADILCRIVKGISEISGTTLFHAGMTVIQTDMWRETSPHKPVSYRLNQND